MAAGSRRLPVYPDLDPRSDPCPSSHPHPIPTPSSSPSHPHPIPIPSHQQCAKVTNSTSATSTHGCRHRPVVRSFSRASFSPALAALAQQVRHNGVAASVVATTAPFQSHALRRVARACSARIPCLSGSGSAAEGQQIRSRRRSAGLVWCASHPCLHPSLVRHASCTSTSTLTEEASCASELLFGFGGAPPVPRVEATPVCSARHSGRLL